MPSTLVLVDEHSLLLADAHTLILELDALPVVEPGCLHASLGGATFTSTFERASFTGSVAVGARWAASIEEC